jgi:hypothetical protein
VINGLEWLEKDSAEGDVNLLFLAGHGATVDQHFYFLAADSDPEAMRATAVSKDEILRTIRNRKGHGGDARRLPFGRQRGDGDGHQRRRYEPPRQRAGRPVAGRAALCFGTRPAVLLRAFRLADGAFTRAMLDGLAGAPDRDRIGYVDTEERVKRDAAPEMKIVLLK